jgi:hypothetical protein
MPENITNKNLESHYSTQAKAQRPLNPVAKPPEVLPTGYAFSDSEANKKFNAINQDIYTKTKKAEKKDITTFAKVFGAGVASVLAYLGIKSFFKKS